jgi:hypothetical protein
MIPNQSNRARENQHPQPEPLELIPAFKRKANPPITAVRLHAIQRPRLLPGIILWNSRIT